MNAPIVVGLDFSPCGEKAFAAAVALAKDTKASLVLVHAFPDRLKPPAASDDEIDRLAEQEGLADAKEAEELTTKWAAMARREGLSTEVVAGGGRPQDLILSTAAEKGAGIIVVGTRSRGRVARALLGSVAQSVVGASKVPVLVVPE